MDCGNRDLGQEVWVLALVVSLRLVDARCSPNASVQ